MTDSSPRDFLRGVWRALLLSGIVLAADVHFLLTPGSDLRTRSRRRAIWSRRALGALGIPLTITGTPPTQGVIVGNHLSYIDIITYGAALDGVFISKIEVRSWPLIGLLTRLAGSIYIDRGKRTSLAPANAAAAAALQQGIPVTFFPEGTTSDGNTLLRFHPSLFQPAIETAASIWPAALIYRINGRSDGVADLICWVGEQTLAPHMLRFLSLRNVTAEIRFAAEPIHATTRTEAAEKSHTVVAQLLGLPPATD